MFAGQDNMLELSCLSGIFCNICLKGKICSLKISQQMITNVFDKATSLFSEKSVYFYFLQDF